MSEPSQIDLGIIGGTGIYQLDGFEPVEQLSLQTRWGVPSSPVWIAEKSGRRVAFLARHGEKHSIPPHRVNYRANLWALKECGVSQVIAVAAVGGISDHLPPATVIVPDQLIDYTYGREQTYFAEDLESVTHIDFTEPYSAELRQRLLEVAAAESVDIVDGGVYAATQGPRLETAAEVERLRRDGADIIGMTGMPEASLAREIELEYACCALVVNWAAGCAGTRKIDHDEMFQVVDQGMGQIHRILAAFCSV